MPASDLAGAGMSRHLRPRNGAGESFAGDPPRAERFVQRLAIREAAARMLGLEAWTTSSLALLWYLSSQARNANWLRKVRGCWAASCQPAIQPRRIPLACLDAIGDSQLTAWAALTIWYYEHVHIELPRALGNHSCLADGSDARRAPGGFDRDGLLTENLCVSTRSRTASE